MDEETLEGLGLSRFFLSIIVELTKERLICRSPRGQLVGELLNCLLQVELDNIAVLLLSELNKCIMMGRKHKLPSLAHGAVWSAFHELRNRTDIITTWKEFRVI